MRPLIQPDELAALLAEDSPVVLVDVSHRLGSPGWGRARYEEGHLPGARFLDLGRELAGAPFTGSGGRHPVPSRGQLAAAVRRVGIDEDSWVVAMDQDNGLAAARLWWLLVDAGHRRCRVLDGGVAAWVASGGALTTRVPKDAHGRFDPQPGRLPVVAADQLPGELAAGHQLVDVRAAERFRGESEPIDAVAGHIPGAVNLPATTLQDTHGRFLPRDERRRLLGGLRAGDVLSCGSGLTAAQVLLAAEDAGIEGLRLYPGSWSDWTHDPSRPVATTG